MIDIVSSWLETIPWDTALWCIVLLFIALDVIVGTVQAIITKTVSSEKARKGILHKSGFIAAMLLFTFVDISQHILDLGFTLPTLAGCSAMIVACEFFSLCEHIKEMNPEIKLDFLKQKE